MDAGTIGAKDGFDEIPCLKRTPLDAESPAGSTMMIALRFSLRYPFHVLRIMPSFFRLLPCLLGTACCLPTAPGAEDSPIMALDEVIGIEIQRASLSDKLTGESKRNELLVEEDTEPSFHLTRGFDPEAVRFRSVQTRMVKGGWASAMTIVPTGSGPFPAVFILDEESRYLRFPGIMSEEMTSDDFEGPAYARIPLASHLVGSGFAAAMATPRTSTKGQGTMTDRDWIALIRLFKKTSQIDPESLFLVATHEFAELAFRLAVQFQFAGLVIEAPREMMFVQAAARAERKKQGAAGKSSDPTDPPVGEQEDGNESGRKDYFHSETHMIFYAEHAHGLKAPTLVILAKEAPEFDQTRQTFLAALVAGKVNFSAVLLDRWARTLAAPGEQDEPWIRDQENPRVDAMVSGRVPLPMQVRSPFRYENDQFSRWIAQMHIFLVSHSASKPRNLRPPPVESIGPGRDGLDEAFGQIEGGSTTGSEAYRAEEDGVINPPDRDLNPEPDY